MLPLNYIAEIKAFYDWLPFNSLPTDAQALWHALMYLNNRCAVQVNGTWYWRVEFTMTNTMLLSILHFSRQQLDRMRNALIQARRIEYRKGKGNQCGTYRMCPFDANYVTQSVTHPDTQTVTQVWTQTGHNRGTLDNNNYNPNSNLSFDVDDGSAHEESDCISRYLEDRELALDVYFGMSEEIRQQTRSIAEGIFTRFASRPPTEQDVVLVFHCVRESRQNGGVWSIAFPEERIRLLLYAFEQAAAAGTGANWRYVQGVLKRLQERGIATLAAAERYDDNRAEMR